MSKSIENLKSPFAGESQASMKYRAFALQADAEGFGQAARLFRATELAETIHAHNHLKDLQTGINGETYEFTEMYPAFDKDAKEENNTDAIRTFMYASEAEKVHADLYKKYLSEMKSGAAAVDVYVCMICGHVAENEAPETCPICGAKTAAFRKID